MISLHARSLLIGPILLTGAVLAYQSCTNSAYKSEGYTYKLDANTGEKVWSHCQFANPLHDSALCGWPASDGAHYLCDPDSVLSSYSSVSNIDVNLYNIQTKTNTLCTDYLGRKESFIVAVALIDRIRIPDLQSSDLCINDCNELQPDLNITVGYPTDAEQDAIMQNFADSLRSLWNIGSCGNDVIVLYCKEFNKLYISAGTQALYYLTDGTISDMTDTFMSYIDTNNIETGLEQGLLYLVNTIQTTLQGLTPAHKLLIGAMVAVFVFAAWFFFYLVIRELEMNVWGQEHPWKLFEWGLHFVTGIWVVKMLMLVMLNLSHKGLNWSLGVAVTVFVGCIAMYVVSLKY